MIRMITTNFENDTLIGTTKEDITLEVYKNIKKSISVFMNAGGKEYPEYDNRKRLKRLTSVSPNGSYRTIRTFRFE